MNILQRIKYMKEPLAVPPFSTSTLQLIGESMNIIFSLNPSRADTEGNHLVLEQ